MSVEIEIATALLMVVEDSPAGGLPVGVEVGAPA